ncbi:MAG: dipeptidase [marine benthic group bacterium]|nr:dipeptidase [Gemmatimonadota bacterium]
MRAESSHRIPGVAAAGVCLALLFPGVAAGQESSTSAAGPDDLESRARRIHASVITIDTHADIPSNFATAESDPGEVEGRQVTLPKMRAGGLDAVFFIVYVGQTERTPEKDAEAKAEAMRKFEGIHRLTDDMYPSEIGFAWTADDVERLHAEGKLVATIGIENGYSIGTDISLLEKYHSLGARYFGLTHIGHNDLADSSMPRENLGDADEEHGGVSELGAKAIAEANRLGMMVDVSHSSKKTMLDAARLSRAPIIASHSAVRNLADSPRNLTDEELLALRDNGGVIQIVAFDGYVKLPSNEKQAAIQALRDGVEFESWAAATPAQRDAYREARAKIDDRYPGATLSDFVDHIDYAVQLIGIDHVGISSDFDGGGGIPGWEDASETFNVTLELVRRGYTEEQIRKLWGGNLLRVWREVEEVAQKLQPATRAE